ncbi:MAG: TraB/GumN family protein, partial [Erysipelotrichaceae bacterium]|nr:TraB/GumN family protein [Erysipelotrichaceae bacterium]
SGQEMIEGIEGSKRLQIPLVNADRSIQTTFSRVWRKQNFFDKIKLLSTIISTLFDDEEVSEEDLLNLQKEDMLTAALQEVQKEFPSIAEVLVHERDQVLAYNIRTAPGKKVLAILGAAHCIGIKEEIYKEYEIESLLDPGKKSPLGKILMWAIPVLLILMVVLTMQKNAATGMNQITGWILYNGVLSALGCLLCGAHPLTILTSFVAAPITSLSPLLAAGWFAGMAEAMIRKPQVKDFESMDEDLNSFKGFFRNKIMKVLLIVVFANLGSTLGTFLGGMDIISKFLDVFTK